jgi:hypothetical protein
MKRVIFGAVLALLSTSTWAFAEKSNNDMIKDCLQATGYDYSLPAEKRINTFDWQFASYCVQGFLEEKHKRELAEIKDFLKHNPRYRFPGQSNNKCFGKPREMPFKSAYIEQNGNGFRAGITYKDKMPANCFESAAWDNRDVKN